MRSAVDILDASILVVDDQRASVQLLEQMLGAAGYRCVTSTMDPFAVCALHRSHHYDLILLDLEMSGMDGFQVMASLKEIKTGAYLPILVISAKTDQNLLALACGAMDFVAKPFDLVEVKTRIRNLLEVRLLYKKLECDKRSLEVMALHDGLTGLPNRRLLMDRLSMAIIHARRNAGTMALMYLDLDGFKQVNDTLGHGTGDILLSLIAVRLVASVRQEDTVARLGGDEFVVLLWQLGNRDDIASLASKVIQAVSQPYRIHGQDVRVTVSAGVGIYPMHGEQADMLMTCADMALAEAKRKGKNGYCIAASGEMLPMAQLK